jgi:Fic family protein
MYKKIADLILTIDKFNSLNLLDVLDFEKFNQYAITHHSTTIEGSTLTEVETRLLLDEGITPAGKPLLHSLMVQDHFKALQFIISEAKNERKITASFICEINAQVMKNTGSIYSTVFGEIDATKGMFRKENVSAGNSYFVNYDKVEKLVINLCEKVNNKFANINSVEEKLNLSFDAHFELVSIHPFYDGNGRTSRLLMNYLQLIFNLPMAIVFKEDKAAYFEALQATRNNEDINIFRGFMYGQYVKYLQAEINKFKNAMKGGKDGGMGFCFKIINRLAKF